MRATLFVVLTALLTSACASRSVRDCNKIAGPKWQRLSAAPVDGGELLTRANLPAKSDVLWYGQGLDKVLVCDPSNSLVNPGCGASIAYQFERINGTWGSEGVRLDVCESLN